MAAVHWLIAKTAREMAGEMFEHLMKNNGWFERFKRHRPGKTTPQLEREFVSTQWGRFTADARATLAQILQTTIDDSLKAQIMDALIKDHSIRQGRRTAPMQ